MIYIKDIKRIPLAFLPTPLQEMPRLSRVLKGPRLFIKRDDCTGLAFGGNKVRKLEFIMAEAQSRGADIIVTTSGIQSNWVRQATAAARRLDMKAALVLRTAQFGEKPREYDGNLLLDKIMGADVRIVEGEIDVEPIEAMKSLAEEYEKRGFNPYIMPMNVSESPLAALGYVDAAYEILSQASTQSIEIDYLIQATGAGSTQAGLILGFIAAECNVKVLGVNVGAFTKDRISKIIREVVEGAAELINAKVGLNHDDITILDNYAEGGYGKVSERIVEAIKLVAETEGVLLDPVYTGKAMAALIELVKQNYFKKDSNVVFLHTGGTPALFPYRNIFK